jgi:predicted CXXCH cytochrome family protein
MRRNTLFTVLAVPLMAFVLGLTGCVDEKIVYRDRDLFETPPQGAAGFVGYSKAADKLTTCGNCHVGQQAAWKETAHAGAWEGLQTSSHAQGFCEGCHAVSELGNLAGAPGGWNTTKDARYKDVQCESCHGPGLTHVMNPSKNTIGSVLAPMGAGVAGAWEGCTQCHAGAHHPYADEWASSMHGRAAENSAASRDACKECHTAEDALVKFGLNRNYAEKAEYLPSATKNMSITCAVCHDPHATHGAPGQLRKSITEADLSKNLCMKCHYKRGVPDLSTFRGPHTPEGPVLLGEGGWWPDALKTLFPSGRVETTHGAISNNPKLCAGCHMNKFEFTDAASGGKFTSTGHTFEAIPCLDGDGKPIVNGTCGLNERTYQTCTGAGCHGSEGVARSATITAQLRISNLVAELDRNLQAINPTWRTCRAVTVANTNPQRYGNCPNTLGGQPSPFNWAVGDPINTARGAAFNYDMGVRTTAGVGTTAVIHNPLLIEALLLSTIQQVRKDYNITAAVQVDLTVQFSKQ